MNESFLHYIWQFQYFDKKELLTTEGEKIEVFKPGVLNSDAGPDFFNAKIKIGAIEWAGHVEIHTKASAWQEHHHEVDAAYDNVVLHVVWQNDKPVFLKDGSLLPTLELRGRIDMTLITQYTRLVNDSAIPCGPSLHQVSDITRLSVLDKVLIERLQFKSEQVKALLKKNNNDWEETCYQVLARNFGFKVNSDTFLQLAQNLPYKILLKHTAQPVQVEALLFGVAGFLEGGLKDEYFQLLQREFKVLSAKYGLEQKKINPARWKFLRLRPANFPSIRLAQWSAVISRSKNIFSQLLEARGYAEFEKLFSAEQSSYWRNHYRFGTKARASVNDMGESSIDNLIINSVVPLLAAYSVEKDEPFFMNLAQEILQQRPAESNKIIRAWNEVNWKVRTAFDSQALIELYNNYCQKRNCLNCAIGASLMRPGKAK